MEVKDPKQSKSSRHPSDNSDSQENDSLIEASKNSSDIFPPAPDGGWGWVIVLASFVISVICDGCSFSFGVLFSELLDAFGESKSKTSWVGSLFLGMSLLLGPFASALIAKYGCRRVTIFGGLVSAVGLIASSFATSINMLCITYGLIAGAGMSMGSITSVVLVSFYFEKKRALATGLSLCGTGIGTSIFAPVSEILIAEYGWRGFLLILGGVVSNIIVCGALFRPLKFTPEQKHRRALESFEKMSRARSKQSLPSHGRSRVGSENSDSSLTGYSDEDAEKYELEQISHSQVQIPTFLNSELKAAITPEVVSQVRRNGSTIEQMLQKYVHTLNLGSTDLPNGVQLLTVSSDDKICFKTKQEESKETEHKKALVPNKETKLEMFMSIPVFRKDIFYRGNILRLPLSQQRSLSCPELYTITSLVEDEDECSIFDRCPHFLRLSKKVKIFVKNMFDLKILKHPLFFLFAFSNLVLYFWADVPYVFIADRAIELGISDDQASLILSVMGICNTVGQVVFGYLGDRNINLSIFYGLTVIISGISVICIPLMYQYWFMNTFGGIFAFFVSSNYTLTTVLLVQYIGLDKLTNACGLLMMIQGVTNLIGPPFAGWMSDKMGSYDETFYTSGIFIIGSGAMMFLVPFTNTASRQWQSVRFEKEIICSDPKQPQQDPDQETPTAVLCIKTPGQEAEHGQTEP
ncbi:monocarboxylate transporter 12-like [Gigantopelta aegis]|uniref:monocarboxylate transporter 12-like n=1 Tax=Gigantopelta aegis TaxID=1735272 RepID=UPI001B88976E|nr:monocarboxylate transporter 12-like [Gigantopelta aegis]XP_041364609.1 monocarboxylate transporter 12-like [Gigantopelta aegis]XP_041364610.1 monocarboxylate transporter 12-like [Gigantopelta aegis]